MKKKAMLWPGKEQLGKLFRKDNLIILVLSGVLLFIIALPTKEQGTSGQETDQNKGTDNIFGLDLTDGGSWQVGNGKEGQTGSLASGMGGSFSNGMTGSTTSGITGGMSDDLSNGTSPYNDEYSYALYLEERLEKILSGVNGVGKVSVMITLESSEELIVEKDIPQSYSDIKETDAQGGERVTSQTEREENTVYVTEGTESQPYVVMRMLPRVEGVLVVAQGAGSGAVNKSITEMIQALFDVEAHKIKVVKMASVN